MIRSSVELGPAGERLAELARESLTEGYQTAIIRAMSEIDRALKQQRVPRKALAERLGVHPSYITRILNDPDNITIRTLYRLSNALGLKANVAVERPWIVPARTDRRRGTPSLRPQQPIPLEEQRGNDCARAA